jgi:thioredoxin 1
MVMEVQNMDAIREYNVLVDFYTSTCAPCKAMHSVLEEISNEFSNIKIAKVEVTKNPEASQIYGVMSVPTVMILQDSKVKEVSRGFMNKNLIVQMIKRNLNGHAW